MDIDFESGAQLPCPCCGKLCPVYDSEVKQWRHLNFWQHATYLSARVPRVECRELKVRAGGGAVGKAGERFHAAF